MQRKKNICNYYTSKCNAILVYDSAVTIPDYTLLVVTGVTCALAWGLPFKPTYPEEELQEKYKMGQLPLLNRNDKNITDTNYTDDHRKRTNTSSSAITATPNRINLTQQHLLKLFQSFYENYPNHQNSFGYNSGYANNNIRKVDSYYFGNGKNSQINSTNDRNWHTKNSLNHFYDRNYNAINSNHVSFVKHPNMVESFKRNPYAEFANYLTQTYFRPWQNATWDDTTKHKTM